MSLHTERERTETERIYRFQCRCGRAGVRRSHSRIVRVTCRDCGADVEWWKSEPIAPFVAPEISIELTKEQIDEIRGDRDTWASLSRKAVVRDDDGQLVTGDSHPNAPGNSSAPGKACTTDAIRNATKTDASDEREQLALGNFLDERNHGI
jgi:hypothetical protein